MRAAVLALVSFLASCSPAWAQPDTEILWDTWGVPHIYASTQQQAFRAFGYAQMHAHTDLLLRMYAAGRGRAAEVYGAPFVELDRNTRTLGGPERGAAWYALQSPSFKANIDAFAEGINEYAAQHPDRLTPPSHEVLPVTGVDVMSHMARALAYIIAAPTECFFLPALNLDGQPASNGWALGPQRTASGNTMLLANPHLSWSDGFQRFFEAQIVAPGVNFSGATFVGVPVPLLGFDDHHGWTHTVSTADGCDVYVLAAQDNVYLLDGQAVPFQTTTQTLKVKQADGSLADQVVTIRRSAHGPVFTLGSFTVAVRLNGIEVNPIAGLLEQLWDMAQAEDLDAFVTALRRNQIPMLYTVYADRAKHTLLAYTSTIPVRPVGDYAFWNRPLPGNVSALIWTATHPFDDLPMVIDPPSGFLQNSNSVPWYMTTPPLDPDAFPAYFAPRELSAQVSFARQQRGLQMLLQNEAFTYDDLIAAMFDTHVETADRILSDLRSAASRSGSALAKDAAQVLMKWDRRADPGSKGAALYFAFYQTWIELTIAKRMQTDPAFLPTQDFFGGPDFFETEWTDERPLKTPRGLADPALAVQALETAAQGLMLAGIPLDVEWGAIARFRRGSVNEPGWGGGDPTGVFAAITYQRGPDGALVPVQGETFIAAVMFGDELQAGVLLSYGNSSRPDSPHNGDQLTLLANRQLRDPWRTRAEVVENLESAVTLP